MKCPTTSPNICEDTRASARNSLISVMRAAEKASVWLEPDMISEMLATMYEKTVAPPARMKMLRMRSLVVMGTTSP